MVMWQLVLIMAGGQFPCGAVSYVTTALPMANEARSQPVMPCTAVLPPKEVKIAAYDTQGRCLVAAEEIGRWDQRYDLECRAFKRRRPAKAPAYECSKYKHPAQGIITVCKTTLERVE